MVDYGEWKSKLLSPEYNQGHLFEGITDESVERAVIEQCEAADRNYPGGLLNYLNRARKLLADSKVGANPFEGCIPEKPDCVNVDVGSAEFFEFESIGLEEVKKCGFILVAGGLGERLGYPNIKISLLTNSLKNVTYCEWYFKCIREFEMCAQKEGCGAVKLPVAIMTSGDTHERTVKLLEENNYFALDKSQVTIMMQEKVPALLDAEARMSFKNGSIEMKPHGHGDVHTLMHQRDLPSAWLKQGMEWVFFFQDTNALSMRSLPVCLGISKTKNFSMNSLCIPRTPGDSVGGICRLTKEGSNSITINVEYNMLDSLLKSAGLGGDMAAPGSAYSAYPGNCNVLVFKLEDYAAILKETGGAVPEFVNPKYADASKTVFKSATRVECMMQEFARLWHPDQAVGATVLDRWFCFSTVKNNMKDAALKLRSSLPGESAFTADAEFYDSACRCLQFAADRAGCTEISIEPPQTCAVHDMAYPIGCKVYLDPSWGLTITQMTRRLAGTTKLRLTNKSGLILSGPLSFTSLDIDGYCCLENPCGGDMSLGDVVARNQGMELRVIDVNNESVEPLEYRVRGYKLVCCSRC
eukprot:Gregarina_sp_Poly_1__3757@NODE_2113_length_2665_cov_900_628176_g1363_i0_p1_GENE_NODE_2113_length_2665_cov_900_628176_g1363_i0NODE_2113_length_2665_cov_900_628176_g1363_i0_p1_ORF_typecomplete_len582_score68_03UDPGP/PF01704_18/4_6e68_NODE_2113_length_2665_cov_900_628176_g1363_i08242569